MDTNPEPAHILLFNRFATPIEPPADTTPRNILVDLDAYEGDFRRDKSSCVQFDLDSACADIVQEARGPSGCSRAFELIVDGNLIEIWIRWDAQKRKYWLSSRELTKFHDQSNPKVTLLHRLNRKQPFRIIVEGSTLFAYGRFYSNRPSAWPAEWRRSRGACTVTWSSYPPGEPRPKRAGCWHRRRRGLTVHLFGMIDAGLQGPAPGPFGPPFEALICDDAWRRGC